MSGRLRMEVVRAENAEWIGHFLEAHVEPGSTIRSDGFGDYMAAAASWATPTSARSRAASDRAGRRSCPSRTAPSRT